METEQQINITPDKQEELWKFGDGSMKNIYDMNIIEVYTCALHAMKRIRHWTDQAHFYTYKLKVTHENSKKVESLQYQHTRCNNNVFLFGEKLQALEQRAADLGEELPEKYEDLKKNLTALKKAHKVENAS